MDAYREAAVAQSRATIDATLARLGPLAPDPNHATRVPPPIVPTLASTMAPLPPAPVVSPGLATAAVTPPNENDLTFEYIALRDRKKVVADQHADELKPLNDRMAEIEADMLARLGNAGVESLRTPSGTAFKKTTTRYNVEDGEVLVEWLQQNNRLDMMARSIKQDAIREFAEETNTLPPGIGVFSQVVVQFRK